MQIDLVTLTLTVNASGDATVYSAGLVSGRVLQIRYVVDATIPLATGADLTITGETTGVAIATITNIGTGSLTWATRQPTYPIANTAQGTAALYAATFGVLEPVYIGGERIKCVVAAGGDSKTGQLHILVG
jgi:hypothetical protein